MRARNGVGREATLAEQSQREKRSNLSLSDARAARRCRGANRAFDRVLALATLGALRHSIVAGRHRQHLGARVRILEAVGDRPAFFRPRAPTLAAGRVPFDTLHEYSRHAAIAAILDAARWTRGAAPRHDFKTRFQSVSIQL